MSFRSIKQTLSSRMQELSREKTEGDRAVTIAQSFFQEEYGDTLQGRCKVTYDNQRSLLTLITSTKTLANDILLRSGDLGSYFRRNGIPVKQLIVR